MVFHVAALRPRTVSFLDALDSDAPIPRSQGTPYLFRTYGFFGD